MRSTGFGFCVLSALVSLGPAQDCATYRMRGLTAHMNKGPLRISLLLESDVELYVLGPTSDTINTKAKRWHVVSTEQKGSRYCVSSSTLWDGEKCSDLNFWLTLRSNVTTLWKISCSDAFDRCSHLFETVYLGLDALPATIHWRPKETPVGLRIGKGITEQINGPPTWHDLSVIPDGKGGPCTVRSASLKLSVPCNSNLTQRDYLGFGQKETGQSFFALDCAHASNSDRRELTVLLIILGSFFLLLLLVALLRGWSLRESQRRAILPAEGHYSMSYCSRPKPPHGKEDGHYLLDDAKGKEEAEEEHEYCYVDLAVLRTQLEKERQKAEAEAVAEAAESQQQKGVTDAVSLSSQESENSLYEELKALEGQRCGEGNEEEGELSQEEEEEGREGEDGEVFGSLA
ncbi:uncharacterized protein LOC122264019 [Penaeus japonicus]|uniref:uncharacterized protein LOC122264019 n=1 Tax=Penaeus japonicus TaxID=27405 RepID=UPI001C716D2C|nr:uncharacterized protein LOC122264019 [Penaeus japonicus]